MALQSLTVATGNVDPDTTTAWFKLALAPEHKAVRIIANCTGASGTAALQVALRHNDTTLIWSDGGTATATARRVGNDGASGNYQCSVVFNQSGNEYVDLAGFLPAKSSTSALTVNDANALEWLVGVTSLTTITSITVYAIPVTDI